MDETNEGDAFCEEDIDQILQRRTHTITIQPGVKGSTFAKVCYSEFLTDANLFTVCFILRQVSPFRVIDRISMLTIQIFGKCGLKRQTLTRT